MHRDQSIIGMGPIYVVADSHKNGLESLPEPVRQGLETGRTVFESSLESVSSTDLKEGRQWFPPLLFSSHRRL